MSLSVSLSTVQPLVGFEKIVESIKPFRNTGSYEPRTKEQDPILNALVIFDADKADKNGTMMRRIRDALLTEVPVFCPVSTLRGSVVDPLLEYLEEEVSSAKAEIQYLLKNEAKNWDFFVDRLHGEQLTIIPKRYFGSYSFRDKLDLLGINPDKVKRVPVDELLESKPAPQATLDAFLSIFHLNSKTSGKTIGKI